MVKVLYVFMKSEVKNYEFRTSVSCNIVLLNIGTNTNSRIEQKLIILTVILTRVFEFKKLSNNVLGSPIYEWDEKNELSFVEIEQKQ